MSDDLKEIPITLESGKVVFNPAPDDALVLLIIDTETTGFTPVEAEVIEVAAVEMVVDRKTGETYSIEPLFDYLREPIRSTITDKITEVTGLVFADVVNQNVDFDVLYEAIDRCDILAAHHMLFDYAFWEDLAPEMLDRPKRCACTCHDPRWKQYIEDLENKKLGTIVKRSGHKFNAHRAIADAIATSYALYLYPEAVKAIVNKAMSDIIYHLSVGNVPWGYNGQLSDLDLTWNKPTKSFVGDFATMDDVLETRTALQKIFPPRAFSSLDISLTSTTPYLRFSR